MFKDRIKLALRYIKFYFSAHTIYDIHKPFLFEFVNDIIEDNTIYDSFVSLEELRQTLLKDNRILKVEDLGAGSISGGGKNRTVKSIAKNALSTPYYCQLLYKITQKYKPKFMLEMGTSLGLSALYQAQGNLAGHLYTLEGSPEINAFAMTIITQSKTENITNVLGDFDENIDMVLAKSKTLDYAFIDGNHKYDATIEYFLKCLNYVNEDSILIFDDIYWSEGMMRAWQEIKAHPKVTISIDLFFVGIIFFKKNAPDKTHLSLVTSKLKPFRFGFWS